MKRNKNRDETQSALFYLFRKAIKKCYKQIQLVSGNFSGMNKQKQNTSPN